jgi:hypothetical protein
MASASESSLSFKLVYPLDQLDHNDRAQDDQGKKCKAKIIRIGRNMIRYPIIIL